MQCLRRLYGFITFKSIDYLRPMSTTEHSTPDSAGPDAQGDVDEQNELLEKDDIFHILQNQRRRDSLRYLKKADETVRMRDLAEQVAAWEHDTTLQALTSDERQRVYIALYQSHLPKLDEEGIINYNQSRGIVERTEQAAQLDPYLGDSDDDEATDAQSTMLDKRGSYYGGVLGLSTLLLGGAALNLSLLSLLSVAAVGVVALTAFTVLAMDQFGSSE